MIALHKKNAVRLLNHVQEFRKTTYCGIKLSLAFECPIRLLHNQHHFQCPVKNPELECAIVVKMHYKILYRPPNSHHAVFDSNHPCFYRNHCQGNAVNVNQPCRRNPKPTTPERSAQPVKDQATTKTL